MLKRITVFTPTYNRAHLLGRLYESLKKQTNTNFIWMIIDDGSTDGTEDLVKNWKDDKILPIEYYYKNNGGMHTAYNLAYQKINTELHVCIDSDDMMPADAIEKILQIWDGGKSEECAGIIGLNADLNGNILGRKAPSGLKYSTTVELRCKYKVAGDKTLVYRTDIMKKMPLYPEFEGEKIVPFYNFLLIDLQYKMIVTNEILCYVEYQTDGSTKTVPKQYFESPRGFAESRKVCMKYSPYLIDRFRNAMHYVSSSIILRNKHFLSETPRKILTLFAIPFGIILTLYLLAKVK
jgi:glycosyltransferase involved in cell wall biosynthesis